MKLQQPLVVVSRPIVMALLGIALVAVLAVWWVETAMGVIRPVDDAGYPGLALFLGAVLGGVTWGGMHPLRAQRWATGAITLYLVVGVVLGWLWPAFGAIDAYTAATLAPWMLLVQLLIFVCMPRGIATLLSILSLLAVLTPPAIALALDAGLAPLARELLPLHTNLALAHLTFTVLLFWLSTQARRLLGLGAELAPAAPSPHVPMDLDELIAHRTQALSTLLHTAQTREAELTTMLATFPGYVGRLEEDWRFSYVNPRLAALLGRDGPAVIGQHARDLLGAPHFELFRTKRALVEAAREPERFELTFDRVDGTSMDMLVTYFMVRRPDGRGSRYFLIGVDISEHRRTERALARAKAEAERADRAKSEFLSRMSHELRTPLNAVLGLSQLLRTHGRALEAEPQRHLRAIERSARHLAALIDDAVDWAHIESGHFQVGREAFALGALAADAVAALDAMAGEHGMRISFVGSSTIAAWGDPLRSRQVLLNLLSNAVKYNRPGGRIQVGVHSDERFAWVDVRDEGPGLSPEQQARLFEPYERLGAERGRVQGTGLGLSIARRLARMMDGEIVLRSRPGEGSTFALRLPRAPDLEATDAPTSDLAPLDMRSDGGRGVVLYVEDNDVNRMVFEACLARRPQLELWMADTAREGLALAERIRPDLVVLDLHLPDGDGLALAKRLREMPMMDGARIALLTADALPDTREIAARAGIELVWHKPIDAQRMLQDLDRLFDAPDRDGAGAGAVQVMR